MMHAGRLHIRRRPGPGAEEVTSSQLQAFRCRHGISGQLVQDGYDAPAKFIDFSEGMRFAAIVLGIERVAVLEPDFPRSEVPRSSLLGYLKLADERAEWHSAVVVAHAR